MSAGAGEAEAGGADATRVETFAFTSELRCRLVPPAAPPASGKPPLLVVCHGWAQDGGRQQRWMGAAVPPGFAAAFPDGFHRFEVRRPERPPRIGHAWYLFSADRPAFLASLEESEAALWRLVDQAVASLDADPQQVWLAGFSQGAYLVNTAAMRSPQRVAGWIAQCGNMRADYLRGVEPDLSGRRVLLQYGAEDDRLPAGAAEACRDLIAGFGADVTFAMHEGGHAITPAMAAEAQRFLAG